ncbi:MAG: hypothetical protein Q9216_003579 [Gyalolechia sp. 2 TL-2023]
MSRSMSPSTPATSLLGGLANAVFTGDSWKLAIPASLYVLQNSLQYFAISNLDTAIFQVTYQFKILPTALFSVVLLGRTLSPRKWLALALLMVGVAIVQIPAAETASLSPLKDPHVGYHFPWSLGGFRGVGTAASAPLYKRSATYEGIQEDDALENPKMNTSMGIAAALMGCTVSSLASVYFEKILKDAVHPVSLWVRNVQLALYSMFPALFLGVFYVDGERIAHNGFFAGYNGTVWATLVLQAIGGMVVSLCVNYADNIAKSFAMSISILISLCASIWFFEFKMTRNFMIGTSVVLFATYLYNKHDGRSRPAPLRIHEYEKTTIDPKSSGGRSTPIKYPATPLRREGRSSSRPSSPGRHHSRTWKLPPVRILRSPPSRLSSSLQPFQPIEYLILLVSQKIRLLTTATMPGLSYDIEKLLREIQGVGQRQDAADQLRPANHATAMSFSNYAAMPPLINPQYAVGSRGFTNPHELRRPIKEIEDYEAPLDAFAGGANTNLQGDTDMGLTAQMILQNNANRTDMEISWLRPREPFQTPPSQLLAEPSSPAHPATSSPLAGIMRRREAQASGYNGHVLSAQEQASTISQEPPIVQGIRLISPHELPDRFRSVFPFPLFNAVQSKCYETAYKTSDNLVLSAPTGSGKTVILELSICHLISGFRTDQFKIVYMAPTKSLCTERQKDWQTKFLAFDLQCAELTGDTNQGQLRNVQNASIIITTPEKWDSITRKWKDHAKLMQLVKLFLIDEVHILKETRGACLEAVVSRMKSVGSDVRFLALSATVPNSEDIATWLGRNSTTQHLPAHRERFGEEFRPVKLQKYVYGIQFNGNDWGFERFCDPKLPEIISKHSHKKPIMVFCVTRKSTVSTAKLLANWWLTKGARDRQWAGPTFRLILQDSDLKETLIAGVAFHHAGLDASDRQAIEKGFLEGQVNVICCTSTLAVGVNLPCHMVIIKNTMGFQDEGLKEYSDLEIMQMLGRAGRPQFEDSAVAVIITKQEKLQKYERMVSGQELLESSLHLNLIEHLEKNAEIGLGTIYNLHTAKRWLSGTFLYVRLGHNPLHYKLDGDAASLNLDDRIERICQRDIDLLRDAQLVGNVGDKIKCSEFGDAMARYYVKFDTMKCLLSLEPRSKMSDIVSRYVGRFGVPANVQKLSVLVGAEEFHDIRYRVMEKKLLKDMNGASGIKYPIKVDIALSQHKRSLIIQAELGGVDFPADEQYTKFSRQFHQDKSTIFSHIHRLVRCVIDCQVYLQDAVTVRHALELARSFAARVWDNSPYQMKQVPNIGPAAVRRLANGGINSIESLEAAEPHKIEMLMSKHPPFGTRILASLKDYPKLRVSLKMMGKDVKPGQAVKINVKAELGFMNEKLPAYFNRKAVYVCFLAERSDGRLIDFRRISAGKLENNHYILLSVELLQHGQHVICYVMCDEIDFSNIDTFETDTESKENQKYARSKPRTGLNIANDQDWVPTQLANGKWACNHKCKDKTACKHLCCHEGVDKPPKAPRKAATAVNSLNSAYPKPDSKSDSVQKNVQTKLQMGKHAVDKDIQDVETVDLAHTRTDDDYAKVAPRAYRSLHQLHQKINKDSQKPAVATTKPSFSYKNGGQPMLTFLNHTGSSDKLDDDDPSSDYGSGWMDDLPSPSALLQADDETDSGLPALDIAYDQTPAPEDSILNHVGNSGKLSRTTPAAGEPMDSSVFADNQYDEAVGNLGSDAFWEASQDFMNNRPGHTAQVAKEQTLFMSTDSPEKPSSPPTKRKCSESFWNEPDEDRSVHEEKRSKQLDTDVDAPDRPLPASAKEDGAEPAIPTIKPGYPDWVYEFDPAFVAEWEPYVEFTKRIPPGTGSKSALRDPMVELDLTGKRVGPDGFKELAGALIRSLEHDDEHGRVCQLEELCLKANALDTTCLPALARIVRLAACDLRDLDLSDNCFSINGHRDADVWEDFLESFGRCYMLRRIDLSSNVLGPKAFEVLARVYGRERLSDQLWEDSLEIPSPSETSSRRSISGTAESLDRQTRSLSLGSALEEYSDNDEHASTTRYTPEHSLRHEMTDAGALHLSYVISCHYHPNRLLRYVPPARSSLHIQQLDTYDNKSGCQGIIYLPNDNVSSPCLKLLELCEGARFTLLDDGRLARSPEAFQTHFRKLSSGRRTSTTHPGPSSMAAGARRRSRTKGEHEDTDNEAVGAELDRARSRIQGNVLKDVGMQSNDLWRTAFQMLGICRIVCPLRKENPPSAVAPIAPIANEWKYNPVQQADNAAFPTLPKTSTRPFVGYLDPFAPPLAAKSPNMPSTPKAKKQPPKLKTATPSPLSITTSPITTNPGASVLSSKPYRSDLPFALPEEAWARVMGLYVGADRFMSWNQQCNVLRWATDRRTLAKELESLGKPESAQIWKVLDGMGCLAYEGDAI